MFPNGANLLCFHPMNEDDQRESRDGSDGFSGRRRRKSDAPQPGTLDRLPPHSIEAEQGVLGCVLLSPNENMGKVIEKLKTEETTFYDLRHRHLFQVLLEMYDRKGCHRFGYFGATS